MVQYKTGGISYRTNLGIDIQAKLGEPVVAVMNGTVKEVGTDVAGQNGWMVTIDHGNGFITKYSNLVKDEKLLLKKGDVVAIKQQIGSVGATSLVSYKEDYGPHLHFEVLQSSKPIDPAKYVKYERFQPVVTKQ
jgi:murein DD-endopeptidase MepM/ murein hydrolase activator NlpD